MDIPFIINCFKEFHLKYIKKKIIRNLRILIIKKNLLINQAYNWVNIFLIKNFKEFHYNLNLE